jgi:hypothetical protein
MYLGRKSTAETQLYSLREEPLVNRPVSDLNFEEIAANIQRLKQVQTIHQVQVPIDYRESIERVNDALRQGAHIAIRVHHHSFTSPPAGVLFQPGSPSLPYPQQEGCLLILNKIVVTSTQLAQNRFYSISLQFWDDTHKRSSVWQATTIQPQWEWIVQQAAQPAAEK